MYEEHCSGSGYKKHCSQVPKQSCKQVPKQVLSPFFANIPRKVAEFVKSDRNEPIPFIDKSQKVLFSSKSCNPFKITVSSTMMLLPGAQKQSCPPVRPSAKGTLSPSSTTSSGHHVKRTVRKAHGVQGLSAFTTLIRSNFSLQIHLLALSNHIVKPA